MIGAHINPKRQRGMGTTRLCAPHPSLTLRVSIFLAAIVAGGCHRSLPSSDATTNTATVTLTSSAVRADRRLYDGAPPVIPHKPLNIKCTECHTSTGKQAPPLGFAPANPHAATQGVSGTSYCQQCHVFRRDEKTFLDLENDFVGLAQQFAQADRLYPGAPPVIPHRLFMRENCTSCHSGPAARPEIVCKHTERTNCRQCHVPVVVPRDQAAAVNLTLPSAARSSGGESDAP
jgi:nitrate reductase cytochrome c-type subunit